MKPYLRAVAVVLALALTLLAVVPTATAQRRQRVMRFGQDDEIVIRGEVMRPQLVVLLTRRERRYGALDRDMNFLPEVGRALDSEPLRASDNR